MQEDGAADEDKANVERDMEDLEDSTWALGIEF
jgi:hypothetical protein